MIQPLLFDLGVPVSMQRGLIERLDAESGEIGSRKFPDGETYLRILSNCTDRHAIIACSLNAPDAKLLPLLFAADTLRELGAVSVGLVAPYLAYMRQDRRFQSGEAVTAPMFARLLSAHFDWLTTVDPHLHRFVSLDQIYTIPTRVTPAAPVIAQWLRANVDKPLLVGPDVESEQWVAAIAELAGVPWIILEKTRLGDHEVRVSIPRVTEHRDCTPVLVDDIVSTGRTMVQTLQHFTDTVMARPICIAVHGIFAADACAAMRRAGAARIASCNTVEHESNIIDVAAALGEASDKLLQAITGPA